MRGPRPATEPGRALGDLGCGDAVVDVEFEEG